MASYDSSDKQPMDKSEVYIPERHTPSAFRDQSRIENVVENPPGCYWPPEIGGDKVPRPPDDH